VRFFSIEKYLVINFLEVGYGTPRKLLKTLKKALKKVF